MWMFVAFFSSVTTSAWAGRLAAAPPKWAEILPEWAGGVQEPFEHKLGSGPHGTVYRVRLPGGDEVALKVSTIEDPAEKARFNHERFFLRRFHSDNVVNYRGSMSGMTPAGPRGLIFMEKGDATLLDLMDSQRKGKFQASVPCKLGIAVDVLRGLYQVERALCVHRDVAPGNIILFGDWRQNSCRAKLGDFGSAGFVSPFSEFHMRAVGVAGTAPYIAPELLLHRVNTMEQWTKTDVWSAGLVLTELFTGSLPKGWMTNSTEEGWHDHARYNHNLLHDHIHSKVKDVELQSLLLRMTHPNCALRPHFHRAMKQMEKIATQHGVELPERKEPNRHWEWLGETLVDAFTKASPALRPLN